MITAALYSTICLTFVVNKSSLLVDNKNNATLYIASFYYVMTTFATVGYGDFTGSTNQEYVFTMITQFLGIGFFGYVIGNISTMIGQIDSIQELQELEEELQSVWQMKLDRSNKEKYFSRHYYDHMNSFFSKYWSKDFNKLQDDEFYIQLKPKLKNEVDDICFRQIFTNFAGFFKDLEPGFKRAVVHNLVFEEFRTFPPYTEVYKDDKRSFPDRQRNILLTQNHIPNKIYFVTCGEAFAANSTGRYVYFRLPDCSYFGDTHALVGMPLSYSFFYDEKIGCSALTIETEVLLKICNKFPDSFRKLRERSHKRRLVLRQYKYEAIKQITELSIDKFSNKSYLQTANKMYDMIVKGEEELDPIAAHAKQRINLLKKITHMSGANNLNSPGTFVSKSSKLLLDKEKIYKSKVESETFPLILVNDSSIESLEEFEKVEECDESKEHTSKKIGDPYKSTLNEGFDADLPKIDEQQLVPDICEISEEGLSSRRLMNKQIEKIASNPNARKFIRAMNSSRNARKSVMITGDNKLKLLNDLQETNDPSSIFKNDHSKPNIRQVTTFKEVEVLAPRNFKNVLNHKALKSKSVSSSSSDSSSSRNENTQIKNINEAQIGGNIMISESKEEEEVDHQFSGGDEDSGDEEQKLDPSYDLSKSLKSRGSKNIASVNDYAMRAQTDPQRVLNQIGKVKNENDDEKEKEYKVKARKLIFKNTFYNIQKELYSISDDKEAYKEYKRIMEKSKFSDAPRK